jgi:hypothetical protein
MDCPVCENAMITLELEDVEIDHCIDCGGIWLDAGELELLLGEPDKARSVLESFAVDSGCSEKRRKCPICDKKMQKIIVGDSTDAAQKESTRLLIDKCRKGDGLWFDKGELQEIFDKAKLDQDNKIQELLADMFGYDRD